VILWFCLHAIYAPVSPPQPTEQQRSGVKPIALEKLSRLPFGLFEIVSLFAISKTFCIELNVSFWDCFDKISAKLKSQHSS
jgi:hypothetical protein